MNVIQKAENKVILIVLLIFMMMNNLITQAFNSEKELYVNLRFEQILHQEGA